MHGHGKTVARQAQRDRPANTPARSGHQDTPRGSLFFHARNPDSTQKRNLTTARAALMRNHGWGGNPRLDSARCYLELASGGFSKPHAGVSSARARRSMFESDTFQRERSTAET
jgi:hypothetical protein